MNRVSAAFESPSGLIYLFGGSEYVRLNPTTGQADEGYPLPIAGHWPGLFEADIDAAVPWKDGKVYFFKGDQYVRYDLNADRVDEGYPLPIAGNWPGLFERDIDAAVLWDNGKAFFFKGDQYVRYDVATDRVDDGYPLPIAGNWPGMYDRDIDDVVIWSPGRAAFIKGDQFLLYDMAQDKADDGGPRAIPAAWFGPPSIPVQPAVQDPSLPDPKWAPLPPRARVVHCCLDVLALGTMGHGLRGDFYRQFINCGMSPAGRIGSRPVEDISPWATSCAIFVRAIHHWCARTAKLAVNGSGIIDYLQASFQHPAWVPFRLNNRPQPGDVFYVASTATDGHVGIFLMEASPDLWQTAEGGGTESGASAGTACRLTSRSFEKNKAFDFRPLQGWWDCELLGFPPATGGE